MCGARAFFGEEHMTNPVMSVIFAGIETIQGFVLVRSTACFPGGFTSSQPTQSLGARPQLHIQEAQHSLVKFERFFNGRVVTRAGDDDFARARNPSRERVGNVL